MAWIIEPRLRAGGRAVVLSWPGLVKHYGAERLRSMGLSARTFYRATKQIREVAACQPGLWAWTLGVTARQERGWRRRHCYVVIPHQPRRDKDIWFGRDRYGRRRRVKVWLRGEALIRLPRSARWSQTAKSAPRPYTPPGHATKMTAATAPPTAPPKLVSWRKLGWHLACRWATDWSGDPVVRKRLAWHLSVWLSRYHDRARLREAWTLAVEYARAIGYRYQRAVDHGLVLWRMRGLLEQDEATVSEAMRKRAVRDHLRFVAITSRPGWYDTETVRRELSRPATASLPVLWLAVTRIWGEGQPAVQTLRQSVTAEQWGMVEQIRRHGLRLEWDRVVRQGADRAPEVRVEVAPSPLSDLLRRLRTDQESIIGNEPGKRGSSA